MVVIEAVVLGSETGEGLELAMLNTVAVIVKVELDSTLEVEREEVSAMTTEDEVGSIKDEPRL